MGNTHTRRNKRGGRHNRGAAPRVPSASAGATANTANTPVRPPEAPTPEPSAPSVSDASRAAAQPSRHLRSASEPSLRAPYAPGQRASRGPRRPAAPQHQAAEVEVTATYEEVVVFTQRAEALEDAEDHETSRFARGSDGHPPAGHHDALADADLDVDHDPEQERPVQRRDGHTYDAARRGGPLRDRDREHDHSYIPAHLRPAFEQDGTRAEQEVASRADEEDASPRGDVRGDVGPLIDDLKALFQRDRAIASATGGTRCGICYLHFAIDALEYREDEGYYVCASCAQTLGSARVPMVRRQKRA